MIDWSTVFEEVEQKLDGATYDEIQEFVNSVSLPLSGEEVAWINKGQSNPWREGDEHYASYQPFDPTVWPIPSRPLPPSYLSLLQWSNGGAFRTGDRRFQFFSTLGIREMMLAYHVPEYMPRALPIAFDGSGTFYLFDTREPASDDEYPVVCSHAGAIGWQSGYHAIVGSCLEAACRSTVDVCDLLE